MLTSQILATAAHLHVLLRRKTGRVTDTEWMAQNLDYALEVIRYSRAKAVEDGHTELSEWADKLEQAVVRRPPAPARALAESALHLLRPAPAPARSPTQPEQGTDGVRVDSSIEAAGRKGVDASAPRYVGGIR